MKRILFGVGVTLVGVFTLEKFYTRAYYEGYNKGVNDCKNMFETTREVFCKPVERKKVDYKRYATKEES